MNFHNEEWTINTLRDMWDSISGIASSKYGLTWYEPQFEIVDEEGMIQACARHALPDLYDHWSVGKNFVNTQKQYRSNKTNLAYEVIINSNPSVCYLMSSNSTMMMLDVISHASCGHSSFFKNNFAFKDANKANTILMFCNHFRSYLLDCEKRYGNDEVEKLIDLMHAVSSISHDKYPLKQKTEQQKLNQKILNTELDSKYAHHLFDSLRAMFELKDEDKKDNVLNCHYVGDDNLLRIIYKYGDLPEWKKHVIELFMYLNNYFKPQMETKVSNEGYATFWDYQISEDLLDNGLITNGQFLEHLHCHSSVCYQSIYSYYGTDLMNGGKVPMLNPYYSSINPYKLGFHIYKEIQRVCKEQDPESLIYVPVLKGMNWVDGVQYAMEHFRDDSFISQFVTPNLIRKLKIACIRTKEYKRDGAIKEVMYSHLDDYDSIRLHLGEQYSSQERFPTIKSYVRLSKENKTRLVPKLYLVYSPIYELDIYDPYKKRIVKMLKDIWRGEVIFTKEENFKKLINSPD